MQRLRLPGLIDAHVHLREPGGEHKEDITTGTAAALAGGIAAVLDMPNNTPPIVDAAGLEAKWRLCRARARCDYALFLGGGEGTPAALPVEQAVGLKLFLTPSYGPLHLESLATLLRIVRGWKPGRPIAVHAEGLSMAIPVGLAQMFGVKVHVCHVATAAEIALVRAAKERGAPVTCEVTPHHLFLDRRDAASLGPLGQMKPPLAEPEDVAALWENLAVADLVASDHAPHTLAEKRGAQPPPGVPGVETMLPLLLDAVAAGRLDLQRVVELLHDGPRKVYGLVPPQGAVYVDLGGSWRLQGVDLHSKCGWTPYEGRAVRGCVRRVELRGRTVYEDGGVLAEPGYGRPCVWQ